MLVLTTNWPAGLLRPVSSTEYPIVETKTIKAKIEGDARGTLEVTLPFPDNLEEANTMWTPDVVFGLAYANAVIKLQAHMRAMMARTSEKRMTDEAIREAVAKWKPEADRRQIDPAKRVASVLKLMAGFTPEQLAAAGIDLGKIATLAPAPTAPEAPEAPVPVTPPAPTLVKRAAVAKPAERPTRPADHRRGRR
jgi:hypothetical protein